MKLSEMFENFVECWKMRARIKRTVNDHLSTGIPKVAQAGQVLTVDGRKVQMMHNGLLVSYGGYHGHWMAKIIRQLKGHHEPYEELLFDQVLHVLPDDAIMLEVGSYWAYYSLWFKYQRNHRICYLIEPNPEKIEVGKRNFAINHLEANFSNYFISDKDGKDGFLDDFGKPLSTKSTSIDGFMKREGLEHLHILHADIQGAELDMLEGASECLSQYKVDYLFISTHDDKHQKCIDKLISLNYRILAEHDIDDSSSADGLILAASPNALISKEHIQTVVWEAFKNRASS